MGTGAAEVEDVLMGPDQRGGSLELLVESLVSHFEQIPESQHSNEWGPATSSKAFRV